MSWLYVAVAVSAVIAGTREIKSAQQQEAQHKANAQAHDYNEAVKRSRAGAVLSATNQREETLRRKSRLEAGKRAASIAEAGLGFGGSMGRLDDQSNVYAELDALNVRYEGALDAQGLMAEADSEAFQSRTQRANARSVRSGRYLNAAGSAFSAGLGTYLGGGGSFG